jgi:repressor LexA
MNQILNPKEKNVLLFIKEFKRKYGNVPTLKEISNGLGYSKPSSIQRFMTALYEQGYLVKINEWRKGYEIAEESEIINIPIVGNVACGKPILADENIEGYLPVDRLFIKGEPSDYFILKAQGDSMDKAGIDNGDFVLIKKQDIAENGDKVVALINDEATIKILKRMEDYVVLEPRSTNPRNNPIVLRADLTIQGVVKMVIKL